MTKQELAEVVNDWVLFHAFRDDCDYPLISPSDVVIDDLIFRLQCGEYLNARTVASDAKARWDLIPNCKGKERRLRRNDE